MSSYFRNNDGYRAAPDQSRPPDNINRGGNMSRPSSRPSSGQSRPTSSSAKIPPYFLCPISHQLMEDPTITKCGHMFDKETLINYINEVIRLSNILIVNREQ